MWAYSRTLGTKMIEVVCNDRLGKKVRVKCNEDDTIGDLKKLIAAQTGTRPEKIRWVEICHAQQLKIQQALLAIIF